MFVGKQLGYLISGPLQQIPNLRQILEAYTELQRANLAGIVSDDCQDCAELDGVLDGLARRLVACAQSGYLAPPTFLGVAGRKLFRDEIWGSLRFVFHADHRYYQRHGLYDFPRRSLKTRLTECGRPPADPDPALPQGVPEADQDRDGQAAGTGRGTGVTVWEDFTINGGTASGSSWPPGSGVCSVRDVRPT